MQRQVSSLLTLVILAVPHLLHAQRISTGAPASSAQASQLNDLYRRLLLATQERDTGGLKQILAPGYTFVPPRADTILSREQRIANTARDTSGARFQVLGCRSTVYGEAAVGHCRYNAIVSIGGTDSTRNFLSTVVFVKQRDGWQIAATHPSPIRPR